MKRPRFAPNTQHPRKGIRRTQQRVTQQQRNSAENESHYQAGREWAQFQTDAAVERRRGRIAAAIPVADFVPGKVHKPEAHDGALEGVYCSC